MTILVGDSIGLSMADDLKPFEVKVNAEVGRQFATGLQIVKEMKADGRLHRRMVIELGTNGTIKATDMDEMLDALAFNDVWLVNNYGVPWAARNNELMKTVEKPGVRVIRWKSAAKAHPQWFETDPQHIHPNAEGQAFLAGMIAQAVDG